MADILAKYNQALVVPFMLHTLAGDSFQKTAVHAVGDSVVMKDEGVEANTTNAFLDEGSGYSITLTAAEMTAARVLLMIEDLSGPKVWLSRSINIWTFGNALAHIPFDLSQVIPQVNTVQINSDAVAAARQALAAKGIVTGTFVTGTLSTVEATTDLAAATDDFYLGRTLIPIGGALAGQATRIRRYTATGGKLLYNAMTGAPANGDPFIIV